MAVKSLRVQGTGVIHNIRVPESLSRGGVGGGVGKVLTTFCRPSMRLPTMMRRPLSSWKSELSSSHERSHTSELIFSVFCPMKLVVMTGLTSMISALPVTVFASTAKRAQGGREVDGREMEAYSERNREKGRL